MEFFIALVFAVGVLYCFLHTAPDTYKKIRKMFRDGTIWDDCFEGETDE